MIALYNSLKGRLFGVKASPKAIKHRRVRFLYRVTSGLTHRPVSSSLLGLPSRILKKITTMGPMGMLNFQLHCNRSPLKLASRSRDQLPATFSSQRAVAVNTGNSNEARDPNTLGKGDSDRGSPK